MSYAYLNNIEIEEALKIYFEKIGLAGRKPESEEIPVTDAYGRITAEAAYAKISSPHYNACAMDGIAVLASSTFGTTETTPIILKEGCDFDRVDTGDPLPDKFDAVVMIEDVVEAGPNMIKLHNSVTPWQHVRQIGEDICAGEIIIASNTRIEPASIGAMLAGGVLKVKVWEKPAVGIIPTGDEIVAPTDSPRHGEIIEFNSSIFSSMLQSWGATSVVYDIIPDKYELIKETVKRASQECDMVLLNAGSSAGREDFSAKVISEIGTVFVHGIAIRPGKPTILGIIGNCSIIGVPGYPVSGIIVMEKVVKPVIEHFIRCTVSSNEMVEAVMSRKLVSSLKYREYIRMKLGNVGGKLVAIPLNRGAGVITSFVKADGILEIPINQEGIEAGQKVNIQLLRSKDEIDHTLVVTGSHDPLIDIISDMVRRRCIDEYVSSSHVGSMGGIMAVKRSEAHAAGIHLLDEETGNYNMPYIQRYLADNKILVLKCVKRIQGLMVSKNNLMSIKEFPDLLKKDLRYVNRQKGSGTRILFDYMLKKEGIQASSIYGYDHEEFTHMSVAALIASGSADAGMGILSAAKIYHLDFIPLCEEQYDFIMPAQFMNMQNVRHFIEILKSDDFKTALENMGGYILENPGEMTIV